MSYRLHAVYAALLSIACIHPQSTLAGVPGVLVTATRLTEATATLPVAITTLTREDIERSTARNLTDLLKGLPGITTRSLFGNNGAGSSIDLRGFGATAGQNMLLLVDGRRLNDVDLTDPPAIPLTDIERIEILHGGGAVLYGDGAIGGSINIITRMGQAPGTHGRVGLEAGSFTTYRTGMDLNHNQGPFAVRATASRLTSDGYRDNNALDQDNALLDLRHRSTDQESYLKFTHENQALGLPGERVIDPGNNVNELRDDRRGSGNPNDYANQRVWSATAGLLRYLGDATEFGIDVGLRDKTQQAFHDDYDFGGAFANYIETDLATWSFTPRLSHGYTLAGRAHRLTIGVDHYRSDYDSDRALNRGTRDTPIHVLDARMDNTGLYAQNSTELSAATTLTLGARWQQVKLRARDTLDPGAPGADFASEAAPLDRTHRERMFEAGLRHNLSAQWSLFGRVGRSVRFATIDEIFQADPDNFYVQSFADLAPQTARQLDLGLEYTRSMHRITATLFGMHLDDEIHFDPSSFSNVNLDPTQRYGLEFATRAGLGTQFEFGLSYTHLRAQFRDGPFDGNDVPLVPRHSGKLDALWRFAPDWQLAGTLHVVGKRRYDNDEDNSFKHLAGYQMLDVKLGTRQQGWDLSLTAANLLGEKAVDYGVRSTFTPGLHHVYPLPGRSVMLGIAREF